MLDFLPLRLLRLGFLTVVYINLGSFAFQARTGKAIIRVEECLPQFLLNFAS